MSAENCRNLSCRLPRKFRKVSHADWEVGAICKKFYAMAKAVSSFPRASKVLPPQHSFPCISQRMFRVEIGSKCLTSERYKSQHQEKAGSGKNWNNDSFRPLKRLLNEKTQRFQSLLSDNLHILNCDNTERYFHMLQTG